MDCPFVSFEDFITEEERAELESYALDLYEKRQLLSNGETGTRFFRQVWDTNFLTPTIHDVGQRIEKHFAMDGFEVDSLLGWLISVQIEGAFVHPHLDDKAPYNCGEWNHFRCNIVVSKPDGGGVPIIAMNPVPIKERGGWGFFASKEEHLSTPVVGSRPRIVYQFGYATPVDWAPAA